MSIVLQIITLLVSEDPKVLLIKDRHGRTAYDTVSGSDPKGFMRSHEVKERIDPRQPRVDSFFPTKRSKRNRRIDEEPPS